MMANLNANNLMTIDVFQHYKNMNPITYGDKDPESGYQETCLTYTLDLGSRQSLDYIFECYYGDDFIDKDIQNTDNSLKVINKRLNINPDLLKVEKFIFNNESIKFYDNRIENIDKKKYTQLSDHFGLCCEVVYNKIKIEENDNWEKESKPAYYYDEVMNEEQRNLLDNI